MAVFRWGSALDAFREIEREMDRWVRSVDLAFEGLRLGRPFPALNLYEVEDEFLITAELPGTRVEDLEISVAGGVLSLKGARSNGAEAPAERFRRSERVQGKWQRQISLPERVREDEIHAELTNGLLKLHLPKSPTSRAKQIRIVSGDAVEHSLGQAPAPSSESEDPPETAR